MNRFLFCLFATCLFATNDYAQITKGNWMVGGSANFSSSDMVFGDDLTSLKRLQIEPNLGYFFIDQLVVGGKLLYEYNRTTNQENGTRRYEIRPFVRYYFFKSDKAYNLLAEANVGYGFIPSTEAFKKADYTKGYGFKTGPVIYLNNNVGLELTANYNAFYVFGSAQKYNQDLVIALGLQIHLEK